MADKNKFEQMLEKLIAEDRAGAEELFHEIVVEKSRSIYENLLDDDMPEVEVDEAAREPVDAVQVRLDRGRAAVWCEAARGCGSAAESAGGGA